MDRQYRAAKLQVILIYCILGIATSVGCFVSPSISNTFSAIFLAGLFAGIIVLCVLGNMNVTKGIFATAFGVLFLGLAIVLGMVMNSRFAIIATLLVGMFMCLAFFSKSALLIQMLLHVLAVIWIYFSDIKFLGEKNDNISILFYSIGLVIIVYWIEYIYMSYYLKQAKNQREQELSLDDMIKVVEAKCIDAQAAAKSKSTFLANISHELRTPLNAILGMNLLIEKDSSEAKIKEYSESIDASGKELLLKINDILEYALIDSGQFKLSEDNYQLLHLINDVKTLTNNLLENNNVSFVIKTNDMLPAELHGDVNRIKKIIMNLISNAVKYTDEGEIILDIDCARVGESDYIDLLIKVSDTGCGIKEENLEKVFEAFNNEHDEKKYVNGTGIGLSTTTGLLKLMGGTISLDSNLGKGSTFFVSIPQRVVSDLKLGVIEKKAEKIKKSSPIEESKMLEGIKILAVDDVAMNLKVFKGLLKNTSAIVSTASGGKGAIELIKDNKFDIIFLDHMMPDMDGVETLNAIKKIPGFSMEECPVIVLTANAISGAREQYLSEGFVDYMTKPVKRDELLRYIEKYAKVSGNSESSSDEAPETASSITIDKLGFLDVNSGIRNCGDDINLYFEVVKEYHVAERTREMETFYAKEDWKNYEILVHALKSTSKSIGANALSEEVKALEYAAKTGDISYIKEHHDEALNNYKELIQKIGQISGDIENTNDESDISSGKNLIYVIDDDSVNRKVAEGILKKYFNVKTYGNGADALEAMESKEPNIILLDIKMPGMSGFDVIAKMSGHPKLKNIPVILITAEDDTDTEIKGFKEGAMDFIKKPFVPQIMLERINRILELNQLKKYLESEVDRKTSKVAKLSLQAMETLAMTIDAKDKYTNGHSTRVAKYSRMIAEKIGFSEEDLQIIYYMGLLHDIGKIGVPDTIINKDGKLTDEEFAAIKKHPEIGYGILKNITEIPDIEKGARFHHERYDGKGYPDGLKGVEIPLFARVIAVADSYDAMTSKRSYRDVLPQDYVRNELIKGKGTQFDPALADIMVKMMDEDLSYTLREH